MGYVGGKIAGHTGTAQCNRKVFALRKERLQNKQRIGGSTSVNTSKNTFQRQPIIRTNSRYRKSVAERLTQIFVGIVRLTLLLLVPIFFYQHWDKVSIEAYTQRTARLTHQEKVDFKTADRKNAFRLAMLYGQAHWEKGYLEEAQTEFVRALKISPYDEAANLGLTRVLVERCVQYNQNCMEAEAYLIFLSNLKNIDATELINLQMILKKNKL